MSYINAYKVLLCKNILVALGYFIKAEYSANAKLD